MLRAIVAVLCLGALSAARVAAQECAAASLAGVWEIVEIAVDADPGGAAGPPPGGIVPSADPLPSQIIFTRRHYSIVWMPGSEAMQAFAVRWQPTDAEKLRRFGEVVVNTGSYALLDGVLEVRPVISRVPEFMGGRMSYRCRRSGDRLVLTLLDEVTFDGVRAPWVNASSGRIHLTLASIED